MTYYWNHIVCTYMSVRRCFNFQFLFSVEHKSYICFALGWELIWMYCISSILVWRRFNVWWLLNKLRARWLGKILRFMSTASSWLNNEWIMTLVKGNIYSKCKDLLINLNWKTNSHCTDIGGLEKKNKKNAALV